MRPNATKTRANQSKSTRRAILSQAPVAPALPSLTAGTVLSGLREALNGLAGELEASRLLGSAVTALARRPGYSQLEADIREEMQKIVAARAG